MVCSSTLTSCSTTNALLKAIKLKGEYLYVHSLSVGLLAERVGKALSMSNNDIHTLLTAGLLHDIGKIAIRDEILLKSNELNTREWEQIKLHPTLGSEALSSIPELKEQAQIILYHHVGINGNSYPADVNYEHIPLESKIIKICDIFTALTSERPYKLSYPRKDAIAICKEEVPFASKRLSEKICDALLSSPRLVLTNLQNEASRP